MKRLKGIAQWRLPFLIGLIVIFLALLFIVPRIHPISADIPLTYPRIPLPPGINISGILRASDASFYMAAPFDIAAFYADTLPHYGWHPCTDAECMFGTISDTRFLGTYQWGSDPNSPVLMIGVNMMITPGQQVTLFTKHCGQPYGTLDALTPAPYGCQLEPIASN